MLKILSLFQSLFYWFRREIKMEVSQDPPLLVLRSNAVNLQQYEAQIFGICWHNKPI